MANRYFKQFPLVKSARTVILAGKVSVSAAAAVTANSIDFASVAKTGVGEYTITLEDKYVETKSIQLSTQQASGLPITLVIKSDSQASDKKIIINTFVDVAGVPTLVDVSVAMQMHVLLILKDSTTV